MKIEVKEVTNKKIMKLFVKYPDVLYKHDQYYVPTFKADDYDLFNPKKNPYLKSCDTVGLIVLKDGIVYGRVFGIIQPLDILEGREKRCRFFYLDTNNDIETFSALFDYLKSWALKRGCKNLVGPLGFNDTDREGMLIEGFDTRGTFVSLYNYPYYLDLMEKYGFKKDVDWFQYKLFFTDKVFLDKLDTIAKWILKKGDFRVLEFKNSKEVVKQYGYQLFELINKTYSKLYGVVEIEKEIIDILLKKFSQIVSKELIVLVVDKENELAGFALCFPHISPWLQKSKGRLFPFGFLGLLHNLKHYDIVDLGLIGVVDKYKNLGLNALMMSYLGIGFKRHNIKHLETNLMLENNENILSQMGHLPRVNHKKNRSYILPIE
ncbi:MAG: hypothetical protein LBV51_05000 [Acholeplasmatales bacterium]|jgi:hypothetical protein|nr:hypothetical protein [Acholeplasmatales bacterium]